MGGKTDDATVLSWVHVPSQPPGDVRAAPSQDSCRTLRVHADEVRAGQAAPGRDWGAIW